MGARSKRPASRNKPPTSDYQTAPVGARSKLESLSEKTTELITRQPLWGRDQNAICGRRPFWMALPDSPCGGEIKTRIKRESGEESNYQTAPVGARSKPSSSLRFWRVTITRQPLWGRDQNSGLSTDCVSGRLPDSPCGGEIKTT